ncbi:Kidins220 [Symbiodinium microadriaticum]|nr:Kidins220 [Symbiodinium sp. KB8]CAE7258561.1 Kidins220 [Symbiodinium microadriaticum]
MDWSLAPHSLEFDGDGTLLSMYVVTYSKALPYSIFFVIAWGAYDVLLRLAGFGDQIRAVRRGTWALKLMNLTHHGLITPLALLSMWQDPVIRQLYACFGCNEAAALMNRAAAAPLAARALTPVTIGYFTADLLLLSQWQLTQSSKVERYLMLVHHVASMAVWPAAVYFDWVARYVLIMLSYESTSLLLTLLWIISAAGYKQSVAYSITGLLFTGLFVWLRMLGAIPQILAMWRAPPWSQRLLTEAQPDGIHHLAWLWCQSLILPHVMNLFWGVKVLAGFFAVFAGKGSKDK